MGITLDLYSHVLSAMQDKAVQRVDAALERAFEAQRKPAI